eukprot:scaffold2050_cov167-Amphora_coffeaeformis.AAC.12
MLYSNNYSTTAYLLGQEKSRYFNNAIYSIADRQFALSHLNQKQPALMSASDDKYDIFWRSDDDDEEEEEEDRPSSKPAPLPLKDEIPHTTNPRDSYNTTRVVLMSDTHGKHRHAPLPRGDVLIHAGDMTLRGEPGTYTDLADYFTHLQTKGCFRQIILIAGNHDVTLQPCFYTRQRYAKKRPLKYDQAVQTLKASCTYLEDESCTLYPTRDVRVYGSPWSPEFGTWAFTKPAHQMKTLWQAIPTDTDILITHGPPYQRGDEINPGTNVGCPYLLSEVQDRVQPRLHVFGHIHEGRGFVGFDGQTVFVNASNVDLRYCAVEPCVVMDVPHDKSQPVKWVQPVSPIRQASLDAFLEWLTDKPSDTFDALANHLRGLRNPAEDLMNWQEPWKSLPDLGNIYGALCLHRDLALQEALRQSIAELYADSFSY